MNIFSILDNVAPEQKSSLPPGVTENDVNLFKNVQETVLQVRVGYKYPLISLLYF